MSLRRLASTAAARAKAAATADRRAASDLVAAARSAAGVGPGASPRSVWAALQRDLTPDLPFATHRACRERVYGGDGVVGLGPAWIPDPDAAAETNVARAMRERGFETYEDLYGWSVDPDTRSDFWMASARRVGIDWRVPPTSAFDLSSSGCGVESPRYFPGGRLNVADSCFGKRDPSDPALIYGNASDPRDVRTMSFGALRGLANRVAAGLSSKLGLVPGDAVGICAPMTPEIVAAYLGVVRAGCVVVSIADSFAAGEIATRLRVGRARAVFAQDVVYRGDGRALPLYDRVREADDVVRGTEGGDPAPIVVLPGALHAGPYPDVPEDGHGHSGGSTCTWTDRDGDGRPAPLHESVTATMRDGVDISWHDFLDGCADDEVSVERDAMDPCNVLFSSGTTGEPKAIVWSHSTPVKCAVDGHYHQDIVPGDRVAWPTSLGWMMGPWLLFQLVNGASLCLYHGVPSTRGFCEFVASAQVSMLGLVPSLAKAWRTSGAVDGCDWGAIRRFSSTGEAGDPDTAHWLMSRVPGYAPVIEYCGGTEIGGSFLSSTLVHDNVPAMFSTPVLGSRFFLRDEDGTCLERASFAKDADGTESGELVLVPPAVGLSTVLLNRDHHDEYYAGVPPGPGGEVLRKHGDTVECVRSSAHLSEVERGATTPYYRALGRSDDTMNLGGIKVGSVEIENACNAVPGVRETAAVAVAGPGGGPSRLVVYAVPEEGADADEATLLAAMRQSVKTRLNPLFAVTDVVVKDALPRTASNKVMRRVLRDEYLKGD